jgi:hypothetical protein
MIRAIIVALALAAPVAALAAWDHLPMSKNIIDRRGEFTAFKTNTSIYTLVCASYTGNDCAPGQGFGLKWGR